MAFKQAQGHTAGPGHFLVWNKLGYLYREGPLVSDCGEDIYGVAEGDVPFNFLYTGVPVGIAGGIDED